MKYSTEITDCPIRVSLQITLLQILFCVFSASSACSQQAQFGRWARVTDNPAATDLNGACMITSSFGIAVGNTGIVERTTDGGKSWVSFRIDSSVDLYGIAAFDSMYAVCVGTGGAAYLSTDGGVQWVRLLTHTTSTLRGIVFFADHISGIAVGDAGTVVQTEDKGRDWAVMENIPTTPIDSLTAISTDGFNAFIVASNGKVFRVENLGGGRTNWPLGPTFQRGITQIQMLSSGVCFVGGGNWELYKATNADDFHTWVSIYIDTIESKKYPVDYSFFGFNDSLTGFFAIPVAVNSGFRALYNTSNGGRTWIPTTDSKSLLNITGANDVYAPFVRSVSYGDNFHVVLVGDQGTITITEDAGYAWTNIADCPECRNKTITGVAFPNYRVGYNIISAPNNGIQKTVDGGWTWTTIYPDSSNSSAYYFRSISTPSPNHCFAVGDGGHIVSTTDGGGHWLNSQVINLNGGQTLWHISMFDSLHGFVSGPTQLFSTKDAGATWDSVQVPESIKGAGIFDLVATTPKSCNLLMGISSGNFSTFVRCNNLGLSWKIDSISLQENGPIARLAFVDSLHGWAVGGVNLKSKILRTINGGVTWTVVRDTTENLPFGIPNASVLNSVAFADTNNGIVAGESNLILRTTDGGERWIRQDDGTKTTQNYNSSYIAFPSRDVAAIPGNGFLLLYTGDKTTSVDEREAVNLPMGINMSLYPNPTLGHIHLLLFGMSSPQIRVADVLGREILSLRTLLDFGVKDLILDVTALPAGIYFVNAQSGNTMRSESFVKPR